MRIRTLARAAAALAVMVVLTASVAAEQRDPEPDWLGFRVCNRSGVPLEVAIGLNVAEEGRPVDIVSEGWYKFDDGECALLWSGKLKYRYYLLYAQHKASGKEWKGDIPICVSRESFTIEHGLCEAGNYRRMFFSVDTGEFDRWTQNLRP
jgi:uncharacterized membrane protein